MCATSSALELLGLQGNTGMKDSCIPQNLVQFFKSLGKETFPNFKEFAKRKVDDVFIDEWVGIDFFNHEAEQVDMRSQMADELLAAVLRMTTWNHGLIWKAYKGKLQNWQDFVENIGEFILRKGKFLKALGELLI